MNCCYTFDYQFAIKIGILCLLGIILLSLIIYAIYRMCQLVSWCYFYIALMSISRELREIRRHHRIRGQETVPPLRRCHEFHCAPLRLTLQKTSLWSTDLTVEGSKKNLPPAYSTLYFDPWVQDGILSCSLSIFAVRAKCLPSIQLSSRHRQRRQCGRRINSDNSSYLITYGFRCTKVTSIKYCTMNKWMATSVCLLSCIVPMAFIWPMESLSFSDLGHKKSAISALTVALLFIETN